MNYLNTIFTNDFIRALGWTIIHSLWQAAIVAIILGLILLALKRSSSATRYYISTGAMLTVLLLAVITFFSEYSNAHKTETAVQNVQQTSGLNTDYSKSANTKLDSTLKPDFKEKFIAYFDKHLPLIVLIWQMGVLILILKLLGGLSYSQRLKNYQTHSLSEYWQNRLNEISHSIGIQKAIKLMESAIIKAPVVIGYFKPVILFPVGAITGLSQEQVEVILAHELAHIERNDYLTNIFQSVIEVLFFFHPAIWWISANIRNERENACDDIAISVNKDSLVLAKALTNLEFLNHKTPGLAAAFSGNKSSLLNRVKRIVNQHNTLPTFKEGFITAGILFIGLLIMSFSAKIIVGPGNMAIIPKNATELIKNIPKTNLTNTLTAIDDTIVTINQYKNITYKIKGTVYRLEFDDNKKLEKFLVNGDKIPKTNWEKYQKDIDLGFVFMKKHKQEMELHEKEIQKLDLEMEAHDKDIQKHDLEMVVSYKSFKEVKQELLEKEKELQEQYLVLEEKKKNLQTTDADFSKHSKELQISEKKLLEQKQELIRKRKELSMMEFELQEIKAEEEKHKLEMIQEQEIKKHKEELKIHKQEIREHEKEMQIIQEAFTELKKDKLIKEKIKSYEFSFKKSYLKINGKMQDKKVFEKFKKLVGQKSKAMLETDGTYFSGRYVPK